MKTKKDCREFLEVITNMLDEMETDIGNGQKIINVTGLSKTEQEGVITKRNCLEVQKYMLEWFLEKED